MCRERKMHSLVKLKQEQLWPLLTSAPSSSTVTRHPLLSCRWLRPSSTSFTISLSLQARILASAQEPNTSYGSSVLHYLDQLDLSSPIGITHKPFGPQSSSSVAHGELSAPSGTIKSFLWNSLPVDLPLPPFLELNFHAWLYRICLLFCMLRAVDQTLATFLWFSIPEGFLASQSSVPAPLQELWAKWRKATAGDVGKVVGNNELFVGSAELYWKFWQDATAAGIAETEARVPVTVRLAVRLELEMLEAVLKSGVSSTEKVRRLQKRLETLVSTYFVALRELRKGVHDPEQLWEEAIKDTCFLSDGRVFYYKEGVIFSGQLAGDPGIAIGELQRRLDDRCPGKLALLLRSGHPDEIFLLIAPWFWFLSSNFNRSSTLKFILFGFSVAATTQFAAAYPYLNTTIGWESFVLPASWSAILASGHLASQAMAKKHNLPDVPLHPFVFAAPHLVAIGKFTPFPGVFPNRTCLLDIILSGSCASLLISALLIAIGTSFWGPAQFDTSTVVDFHGYVFVPSDIFSYSAVFTKILNTLSVTGGEGNGGNVEMATSPFVLAGLLGLNFTAFCMIPFPDSEGILLVRAALGDSRVANKISAVLTLLLSVSLLFKSPGLALWWIFYSTLRRSRNLMKEEISTPSLLKRVAGCALVFASTLCFFPFL